jgi:hypothetical protein
MSFLGFDPSNFMFGLIVIRTLNMSVREFLWVYLSQQVDGMSEI